MGKKFQLEKRRIWLLHASALLTIFLTSENLFDSRKISGKFILPKTISSYQSKSIVLRVAGGDINGNRN